jgi:hypothetical protein
MKKIPLLFALTLAIISCAGIPPAQAGWVEFFFPTLKKREYDPARTMQAPFAVDEKTLKEMADPNAPIGPPPKFALPENNTPMDQPHRDNKEIAGWLTMVSSEIMTFDKGNYQKRMEDTEKYFTASGREQYVKFLTDNNIIKVLESGKYDVRSFVQEPPLLLNEGAVNGTFRWLYEVPIMLTYVERGTKSYKNVEPVNQQVILIVQIGRTTTDMQGVGVLIERIESRAPRKGNR